MNNENINPQKKKNGGRRPGAGRPKGSKNLSTIEREEALESWKSDVAKRTRGLLQAQTILAVGCIKVFCIHSHWEGSGKNRRLVKGKPKVVESEWEIIKALDYEYGDGDSPNTDTEYYFVSTKDPDNSAIDSLLNRTFGKPKESVAVEHSGKISLAELLGKGALDNNGNAGR